MAKFKSHLNAPITLDGNWKMALIEADITSTLSKENTIYIYSCICQDSIVEEEKKPMLWRLMSNAPGYLKRELLKMKC
jgi:hypothetical protein